MELVRIINENGREFRRNLNALKNKGYVGELSKQYKYIIGFPDGAITGTDSDQTFRAFDNRKHLAQKKKHTKKQKKSNKFLVNTFEGNGKRKIVFDLMMKNGSITWGEAHKHHPGYMNWSLHFVELINAGMVRVEGEGRFRRYFPIMKEIAKKRKQYEQLSM